MSSRNTKRQRGYWNLRVIEFDAGEDSWSAVHEVYYSADGALRGYSSNPAILMWTLDDEPGAGQQGIEKFQRALREPALKVSDFRGLGDSPRDDEPATLATESVSEAHQLEAATDAGHRAKAALRIFGKVAHRWALSELERSQLLGEHAAVLLGDSDECLSAAFDAEVQRRLGYVFRIFGALQLLLPIPERADAWIRLPNAADGFEGGPALRVMLSGAHGLRWVADFLDSQC